MQPHALVSAEERSRAGDANRLLSIAQTQPKPASVTFDDAGRANLYANLGKQFATPRKRSRSPLSEACEDGVIAGGFALAFLVYLGVQVVRGLFF